MTGNRLIDLTGKRFGRWTVLCIDDSYERKPKEGAYWLCRCDCGVVKSVAGRTLRGGSSKSCGCLRSELTYARLKGIQFCEPRYTHGLSKHPLYHIWIGMRQRCLYPAADNYSRYGGRGICVCDEWLNDFQAFYDWSMMNGWSDGLSIDRIDNNGPYAPWNTRWVDKYTQQNNKSTSVNITYNDCTLTVSEWSR